MRKESFRSWMTLCKASLSFKGDLFLPNYGTGRFLINFLLKLTLPQVRKTSNCNKCVIERESVTQGQAGSVDYRAPELHKSASQHMVTQFVQWDQVEFEKHASHNHWFQCYLLLLLSTHLRP